MPTTDNNEITVLYLQGKSNIGDTFVVIGLEFIVKKVLKSTIIHRACSPYGTVGYLTERSYYSLLRKVVPLRIREKIVYKYTRGISQAFEYVQYIDKLKYIVLGGCILTQYYVKKDLRFLLKLRNRAKILMIGVGGENYTGYEIEEVKKFLSELRPYLIVTRDPYAYELYSEHAEFAYNGIDNAYFVSDAFVPPRLNIRYIILNFDHMREPDVPNPENLPIIRIHNTTKGIPRKWLRYSNFFVSDYPEDYLTLIANAEFIYTDRVHTAVVAIAYNRPYKYYGVQYKHLGKQIRASIIKRVEGKDLKLEKEKELKFIAEVLR